MSAVSSKFAHPSEEIRHTIDTLEEIEPYNQVLSSIEVVDDDTVEKIQKARSCITDRSVLDIPIIVEYLPTGLTKPVTEIIDGYGDVSSELTSQFQESGQDFQEIADEAEQINDEVNSELAALVTELENIF